jgi:hypothetical protein
MKFCLNKKCFRDLFWIHLSQDIVQWQAVVNMAINENQEIVI